MCDGKHASKRDVVILSIKPKRPDYPSAQKVVPVAELLQEWDKLDAYYRGQLLKLTRSLQKKSKSKSKSSNSHHSSSSPSKTSHNQKINSSNHNNQKSTPVSKKNSSSLSSDQFTELFGDENLFNSGGRIGSGPRGPPDSNNNKHNKLLHSRSLNNLFDEDSLDDGDDATILPPPPSRHRKSSLSNNVNSNNLVVSIPVLSVQNGNKHSNKYASDDEDSESGVSDVDDDKPNDKREDAENFLSIPRDNFTVRYGTKQKTRVTLLETESVSPKWIVPIKVAPYKPPTAQGLNGIQIQKILYHKNDSVNYPSPTTTTAKTPDKPPDNHAPKPAKISTVSSNNSNSPVSTVSPRTGTASTATTPLPSSQENNNATPKQVSPPLSSPSPKGHGNRKSSPTSTITMTTTTSTKLSPPPLKSPSCGQKLKRPNSLSLESYYGKKQKLGGTGSDKETENSSTRPNPAFLPVTSTSSTYPFSSFSSSSSASSLSGDTSEMDMFSPPFSSSSASSSSKHAVGSGRTGGFMDTPSDSSSSGYSSASGSSSSCGSSPAPAKKLNIIHKNPPSARMNSAENKSEKEAVFISPAAVSITDRIIKKASQPQPELIERQRRRKMESNQRKSYAMQKGDEHEEKESIDLSMKSFEMIWNIPLLSPLRSP